MAADKFVFHLKELNKAYPGGKHVLKDITLDFLPGAKIGIIGTNGAGKSTLMRVIAGLDTEFTGDAWAEKGVRVGYLPQEPELDPTKNVFDNVMDGVGEIQAVLDRYNQVAAIQFENPFHHIVEKISVMCNQYDCAGVLLQEPFQPRYRFRIQMVSRLIEE